MNPLIERLKKILALTTSPVEGEAQAAAEILQKLLLEHNLSVADLEHRGQKSPGIRRESHDLGKAAFKWKLELATVIADHYFCYPMVDTYAKTVAFIGRPDNVESLQMLYAWLIEQIKQISSEERRNHHIRTGEHIDPLRWQVNFGLGVVERLARRLEEKRRAQASNATALVLHHKSEISDWMEEKYGWRVDGKKTKYQQEREDRYREDLRKKEELRQNDIEEFYRQYPEERPEAKAAQEAMWEARREADRKKEERNAKRRKGSYRGRAYSAEDQRKDDEAYTARIQGREAANDLNLEPFLKSGSNPSKGRIE